MSRTPPRTDEPVDTSCFGLFHLLGYCVSVIGRVRREGCVAEVSVRPARRAVPRVIERPHEASRLESSDGALLGWSCSQESEVDGEHPGVSCRIGIHHADMTDLCKRNDLTIRQCGDADCACIEGSFLKNEVKAFRSRCGVQCVIHDQAYD